jgi:hypothetical protein
MELLVWFLISWLSLSEYEQPRVFGGFRVAHRIDLIFCVVIFVLFVFVLSFVPDMFFCVLIAPSDWSKV